MKKRNQVQVQVQVQVQAQVPTNPFIERGSVEGTLLRIMDAIEQVRYTLGEIGSGVACCVPERVYMGHFWTLTGVLDAVEYVQSLRESKKGDEPEPEECMVPA